MPLTNSTTSQEILELAYARLGNDVSPRNIATEETELLGLVNRAQDGLFAFAARINPQFFGKLASVPFEAPTGWLRPEDAESVFRIETVDGIEVVPVPVGQRLVEQARPSVYALGQYYRPTGSTLGPNSPAVLVVFYSRRPVAALSLASTLDAAWPEAFNELLALEVAIYLAMKAKLQPQVEYLKGERDGWASRFAAFLQHETANEVRAWSGRFRLLDNAMSVLAGA